jgi:hypothetical protein
MVLDVTVVFASAHIVSLDVMQNANPTIDLSTDFQFGESMSNSLTQYSLGGCTDQLEIILRILIAIRI